MCNTYCFSTATMVARMSLSVTLYVQYIACLVISMNLTTDFVGGNALLLPLRHFHYNCVTSVTTSSLPLPLCHIPSHCVTSITTASLPLPLRHFPYHCATSLTTASLPLPLRYFPYHYIQLCGSWVSPTVKVKKLKVLSRFEVKFTL